MLDQVPWVDESTEDRNQPNERDIWPNIEADFQFAFDNLPETQSERGRVNSWAAAAYLARAYVYQEKWSEAKDLYDQIIPNGGTAEGLPEDMAEGHGVNGNQAPEEGWLEQVSKVEREASEEP